MYFNNNREETNIDKEFKNSKGLNFDFGKYKKPIIIGIIALVVLIIIILIISLSRKNQTKYFIRLNEPIEMTVYEGSTYTEPGYSVYDNKGNYFNDKLTINGDVDTEKIGTYIITYKYKNITKTRTVKVVAKQEDFTDIYLSGDLNMTIKVGENYTEPGYKAIDSTDGDLTNKVTINGNVDTSKAGVYKLVYSVVNSKGVTTTKTRTITVR